MSLTPTQIVLGICIFLFVLLMITSVLTLGLPKKKHHHKCKKGQSVLDQMESHGSCYQPLKGMGSAEKNYYCLATPKNKDGTCPTNTLDQPNCGLSTHGDPNAQIVQGYPLHYNMFKQKLCYQPLKGMGSAQDKYYCKAVLRDSNGKCQTNTVDQPNCGFKAGTYTSI